MHQIKNKQRKILLLAIGFIDHALVHKVNIPVLEVVHVWMDASGIQRKIIHVEGWHTLCGCGY